MLQAGRDWQAWRCIATAATFILSLNPEPSRNWQHCRATSHCRHLHVTFQGTRQELAAMGMCLPLPPDSFCVQRRQLTAAPFIYDMPPLPPVQFMLQGGRNGRPEEVPATATTFIQCLNSEPGRDWHLWKGTRHCRHLLFVFACIRQELARLKKYMPLPLTVRFSKLPYLGMKLGHESTFQKLHLYPLSTPGVGVGGGGGVRN